MLISMINKRAFEMYRLFITKQNSIFLLLCLIFVGCSYTPHHYSFSLIESQNKTMSFEDENVQFKFAPSAENIRITIKNKTDHAISLVRDNAKYIDFSGESRGIHYGYDYVEEVRNFRNNRYVAPMKIVPVSEITGYAWINIWPDFCIGEDRTSLTGAQINYLKEPFFPRYSFEGNVKELKGLTFNLVLPIDFGEYVRDYTFTFTIDDVIEGRKN